MLVVTSGDSKGLRECLQHVREQADALDAETVLVVNADPDAVSGESRFQLSELVDRVAFERTVGKSHGLNLGVELCRGEVVAFTDDDAVPRSDWLAAISEPLLSPNRPEKLVGCGGRVLAVHPPDTPAWYRRLVAGRPMHFLGPIHDLGHETENYSPLSSGPLRGAPVGANCAYLRRIFSSYRYQPDLGPNRVTGLRGGEDFELGLRLLRDGYELRYCPGAVVEHPVAPERTTMEFVLRGYFIQGVENLRMNRHLGLAMPGTDRLRRKLRRRRRKLYVDRIFRRSKYLRHRLRLEMLRGTLEESLRHEGEDP